MNNKEIQWHPPYIAAMNLEMEADREHFVFVPEYTLNTGALKIDLFIENTKSSPVSNEIGKLFRKYNILEYKNPYDTLSIDEFIKAQAYAGLYKAQGEKTDSRTIESITVSLIRETKPIKLFNYFKRYDVRVTNPYDGIYYILDRVWFSTQIIVTKELDKTKHQWLCALSGKLEECDLRNLLTSISSLNDKMEKEYADSILEVALKANRKLAEQLRSDEHMSKTLMEIMEPVLMEVRQECIKQGEKQGRLEGKREGRLEGKREGRQEGMIYAYYEMNLSTNEIAERMHLTEREILEILNKREEQ